MDFEIFICGFCFGLMNGICLGYCLGGGRIMTEFQRNKIVEAIARTAINACAKYIQKAVEDAIKNNPLLNELFKQRG